MWFYLTASQNLENRTSVPSWATGTLPGCCPFQQCDICHLYNTVHPQEMLIKCTHLQKWHQETGSHLDATATRHRKFDKSPSWPPEESRAFLQQDPSLAVHTAWQAGCGHHPDLALCTLHPNSFSTEQQVQTFSAPPPPTKLTFLKQKKIRDENS